jgi:hypothetical protein
MKTVIKDLATSCELGKSAMAAVRGGHKMGATPYSLFPMSSYSPSYDSSIRASQGLSQAQQVLNETADGSAFVNGVSVNNNTTQFGQNNLLVV